MLRYLSPQHSRLHFRKKSPYDPGESKTTPILKNEYVESHEGFPSPRPHHFAYLFIYQDFFTKNDGSIYFAQKIVQEIVDVGNDQKIAARALFVSCTNENVH